MKRWIKVDIDVDESDNLKCPRNCQFKIFDEEAYEDYTEYGDENIEDEFLSCTAFNAFINNGNRCQACIDADITDLLTENESLKKRIAVLERALKILGEYKPISLRDTDCPFTNDICMNIPDNTSCNECLVTQAMIDAQVEIKGDGILQKEKHGESEVPNEQ